jgi:acetyl esterase/lipase
MTIGNARAKNLLAPVLWLTMAGCAASLPELRAPLDPGEEFVTLATRPGVTVRVLLIIPNTPPKGLFLFFHGGEGFLVSIEGRSKSFFARLFREQGFITALVDVPSDRPYGVTGTDPFRVSKEHLEDVKKVIDFVSQKWSKPIYLIGHSAGTTTVGYLATVLKDDRIGGIVLTGALGNSPPGRVSLATLPLPDIVYPALFVHHKDDECASFSAARQQSQRLVNSPRVNFIEVRGGDRSRAIGCSPRDPSQGMSYVHGFSGKEREVVTAITDWVSGKPVPDRIGP